MSSTSQEQAPQQDLTAQVMTRARVAYDTLNGLRTSIRQKEENTPEGVALAAAVGRFVADNSDALGEIGSVERSPELTDAASAWLEKRLQDKLASAMFSEVLGQARDELTELLAGHSVKATSLQYGFGVGDGSGMTYGPGNPMVVTAPFFHAEPAQGTLWLGTPELQYKVQLWDPLDKAQPASVIEVL